MDTPDALTAEIPRTRNFLRVNDVASGALNLDAKNITRMHQMRIGAVLRELGFERKQIRAENTRQWVYVTTCHQPQGER